MAGRGCISESTPPIGGGSRWYLQVVRLRKRTHFQEPQKSNNYNNLSYSTTNCRFTPLNCFGDETLSTCSAYSVLGVPPNCSLNDLKAAFRTKVKQFHPDVRRDGEDSDVMILRVI